MFKTLFRKDILHRSRGRLLNTAGLCLAMFGATTAVEAIPSTTKICSASDLHYFAPSLLVKDGVAFQTYLAQDRKLIAESKAITEALVAKINEEKPAFFLVTGDLTKDGEKLSHQELATLLESIENNGVTKVFVIPGNHDINNPHAKSFDGDNATAVDYVTPAEFKTIYDKFGYGEAALVDTASITYLAKPSAKLWILGVDACMYKENVAKGEPVTAGKINANTWKWILDRMAEAKAAGATVVGMMHHGLMEHYTGQTVQFADYVVDGFDTVSTKLADAGLKLMFTGHYHANDITMKKGTGSNFVFDIETGSTVTYPCPYRVMNLNNDELSLDIATKYITAINYNTGTASFPAYAKKTLNDGMKTIVSYTLQQAPYSLDAANAAYLSTYYTNAFLAHYAGDEKASSDDLGIIDYLKANGGAMGSMMAGMLTALWTDLNPKDNSVFLDLNTGSPYQPTSYRSFVCKKTEKIGAYSGIEVFETGGSGLTYIPGSDMEFYTLGDRGPNIDAKNSAFKANAVSGVTDTKIFPFPNYNPKIFKIALRGDSIAVLETIPFKRPNGDSVSGRPNPPALGYAGEGVLTENTQAALDAFVASPSSFFDTLGVDCEGIVRGKNNDFWIADEYGVSVWNVAANGTLIKRYAPFNIVEPQYNNVTIDTILARRRANRGFESVAIAPNGKVYALLQSAMVNPDDKSRIIRMLEIDPKMQTSKTYAYLLPLIDGVKMKDWKLGDMTAINNSEFLVLAHGATDTIDRIFITKLDISKATPIAAEKYTVSGTAKSLEDLVKKTDGSDIANLTKAVNGVADITPISDKMFLELYNETYPSYPSFKNIWNPEYSKPEGLAVVNDSTIVLTFDNDFGFASSAAQDGSVTANNQAWKAFVYNLKGENKIKNFTLDSTIASAMDLVVDASTHTIPSVFAYKKAYTTAIAKQDAASVAALQTAIANLKAADMPYNVVTSFNGDPKTQLGFAWFTNVGVKGGVVELVEGSSTDFSAPTFTFAATSDSVKNLNYSVAANSLSAYGFTANSKQSYMSNKALATGLKAGTTYSYRVGKAGAWSQVGSFTTAKTGKNAFSFVYFTDPQANTEAMFDISAKTSHAAAARYPNTNFWLSCGDLIETSGANNSEWEYERFFESQQDIWLKNPLVAVLGNHDKSTNKNVSLHFNTAKTPFDQAMSTAPGSVYSFVYGDALFMAMSYEDYSVKGYLDSLAVWMRAQVAAHPEVKWRIAFYHKTMYTGSGSHQSDGDGKIVRDRMAPLFDSLQIDVALQGHDHIYEVIGPVKSKQLVDGAVGTQVTVVPDALTNVTGLLGGVFNVSEGTLYFLNNSAGKKKYKPRSKDQMTAAETALGISNYFGLFTGRFGQTGEPTFSNVSVSTDTIKFSTYAVKDDGSSYLFDEFAVVKHTAVNKVALTDSAASMFVGRKKNLAVSLQYPDKVTDTSLEWKSSNEAVATVLNGVVTAVSAGSAKIFATAINGGIKDSCTITVIAPQAKYVAGDFHQHSTYTDGSYTYGYMTEKNVRFGLDWWANSEHGGGFTTDGAVTGKDVDTTVYWDSYIPNPITGKVDGTPHAKMWRWQSLRDYEYKQVMATRLEYPNKVTLQSYEWNVPGHEHGSMGLIAGQFGEKSNCDAIAQFEYMFDNSDSDVDGGAAQGWTKSTKSGHEKTLEALAWLKENYPTESYAVPAHPERQKKYTISHFRDMNNIAPDVCFGFESMPGHQKDAGRGGYSKNADGGGTYGGCGVYAAKVGGLWDAMLSEGRHFWLFASSDAHDVAGDFFPGEYQKTYTYTKDNSSAQAIVDGLRSGNTWVVEGDLIDSLIYQITPASNNAVTASMGQSLELTEKGINITIMMRDPQTANYNTYSSYKNPALHHVDVIMGKVGAKVDPSAANYNVPSVATTAVIARFDANGATTDANGVKSTAWTSTGNGWKEMTLHLDNITDSVYFRLRATNLALGVTNETDAAGNPLSDTLMGANNAEKAFADLWMYSNPIFVKRSKIAVDSISLVNTPTTAFVGRTASLNVAVYPANAQNKAIEFKSANEAVAKVQHDSIVMLTAGVAKIYAISADGGMKDSCTITVIAPQAKYVAGDFHQHSTYTDGSYTYGYMTEKNVRFGLDWWANSEHGGGFTTDGAVTGKDVDTTVYWDSYLPNPITGKVDGTPHAKMWRWQSLRDYEYKQVMATRLEYPNKVTLQSYEWNVPGHEHGSMGLIAGQFGEKSNCNAIAQFEYMFDNSDSDVDGGAAQGWTKSTKSGHEKTLEALAWLKENYPTESYAVPAHPERQKKYTISHFRDMNNIAPDVCFGFESMPGHQKDAGRGGYSKNADGGGTYGGCGVYAAKVGGLWDAMLSEGRHFWLFASSDAHDVAGDFFPGEYQKTYTYTKDNSSAQAIVDGLRSGNSWVVEGDLIDSLIYQITPASNNAVTASMGQSLELTEKGINITIKMRDPQTANYNTYSSYKNPALHHVDVIMGKVGAKVDPSAANYNVPSVATTAVIARFDANGATTDANGVKSTAWTSTGNGWKEMTLHLDNITDSVYFRLRATNLSLGVTNETDAAGNPLSDTLMGANNAEKAFADLWMYSNPIFVAQTKVFVDSVKLSAKSATIEVGQSADLTAVVSPANASVQTITWKSMDETIATVDNGKVTAVKAGTVKIVVTTTEGAMTDTCVVTTKVSVASIAFTNKTEKLEVGKSLELTPTVLPTDASNAAFSMKSMDETIAILVNGKVIALKAGKVKIAATTTDGAKTDTCEITTMIPVASVSFASKTLTVEAGKSITIAAVALPAGATENTVTIKSLDATIVSVTGNTITAVKAGTVKLVATSADGLKTDTCVVKVVVPVSGIAISKDFAELQKDETVTLTATIAPTGASNGAYTWKSSKPTVATVVDGVVTAKSNGQAVITVTSEDGSYTATCIVIVADKTDLTDEQKQLFNIYPVPTSDELTIIIPQELSVSSLSLIGSNGTVVLTQSVEGLSIVNLNVSMFAKGNYYVEFFTANGVVTKQVIIK